MASKRKSWQEKLNDGRTPHVETVEKDFAGIRTGQRMLIPTPKLVQEYIRRLPKGKAIDAVALRANLAADHMADVTCPLTTGIFLRIIAEAAHDDLQHGKPLAEITPFWRVIDGKSTVAKKLTFGTAFLQEQRKAEGIE